MTNQFSFTEGGLRSLLQHIKGNYDIFTLADWNGSPGIILRHDVDVDLRRAHYVATMESELGIRSSFFFLLTSQLYNALSYNNRTIIKKIADLDHDVGLHFDPTVYGDVPLPELHERMAKEAGSLEQIIGRKVSSVSLHNPSVHGSYPIFPGYKNAYDASIFNNDNYISDSSMNFRGKEPYAFLQRSSSQVVQLILHPIHYFQKGDGYPEILSTIMKERIDEVEGLFEVNNTFKQQMRNRRLHDMIK